MPKRLTIPLVRQAVVRRFHKAITEYTNRKGWKARDVALHHKLPYRTVRTWMAGTECPQTGRLKEMCVKFNWRYDLMFEKEAIEDFIVESSHFTFHALTCRYLKLQSRDPLESWNYVAMAGSLVFIDLSAAGYECVSMTDHSFGTQFAFKEPRLKHLGLRVGVVFGRGLVISWIDENGSIRGATMDLSNSALDLIKENLHSTLTT